MPLSIARGVSAPNITKRIADLARNAADLSPLRDPVRTILVQGNRERALAGTDAQGRRFAPLASSTLKRRKGSGPPLAPRREASRVVTGYSVNVQAGPGRLTFAASWPGQPWMEYHARGGGRLPRRDSYGFRQQELEKVKDLLRQHIMKGTR